MNMKNFLSYIPVIGLSGLALLSTQAMAVSENVLINGFVTGAYQVTDQDNTSYNGEAHEGGIASNGSALGTRFGLNVTAKLNDRVTLASQMFAERADGYEVQLDWAFIGTKLSDNFDLRMGRIKFPGGLYGEYVDVGYAYPWIQAPQEFYSEDIGASQAVHKSFSGASLLTEFSSGDMTYSANLFAGEVAEETVLRTGLKGITLTANWDDKVTVQAGANSSKMHAEAFMPTMDKEQHEIVQAGFKVDMSNVLVIGEWADVDMGNFAFGESETSYLLLGYHFGKFLPHVTVSTLEKGQDAMIGVMGTRTIGPFEQTATTVGLRWDYADQAAVKFEVSNIELDSIDSATAGPGLFTEMPDDDPVRHRF